MKKKNLAEKIYRLQLDFVRKINDTHIFVQQAFPLLEYAKDNLLNSGNKDDRRYYVPSTKMGKFANRTDEELKSIYDRFIHRELYENLIVGAVSQFESFLFDVLRLVISTYPKKLTRNIRGMDTLTTVPINILLDSEDLEVALSQIIERRLNEISYAKPKDYLEYFQSITTVDTSDSAFMDYIEIKATRDLIIHNSGIINEVYLGKVGNKKRGDVEQKIQINFEYFNHCIATMKRISGIIKRDTEKSFSK